MSTLITELTRRYRFPASHRLHSARLSQARNAELYGKCNNPYGHGHDYVLEVTAAGQVNEVSGLLVQISQLDQLVTEEVLRLFAYRFINKDVPAFQTLPPTTENVALYMAELLGDHWRRYIRNSSARLSRVHLQETDRNGFEVALGTSGQGRIQYAGRETSLAGGY